MAGDLSHVFRALTDPCPDFRAAVGGRDAACRLVNDVFGEGHVLDTAPVNRRGDHVVKSKEIGAHRAGQLTADPFQPVSPYQPRKFVSEVKVENIDLIGLAADLLHQFLRGRPRLGDDGLLILLAVGIFQRGKAGVFLRRLI